MAESPTTTLNSPYAMPFISESTLAMILSTSSSSSSSVGSSEIAVGGGVQQDQAHAAHAAESRTTALSSIRRLESIPDSSADPAPSATVVASQEAEVRRARPQSISSVSTDTLEAVSRDSQEGRRPNFPHTTTRRDSKTAQPPVVPERRISFDGAAVRRPGSNGSNGTFKFGGARELSQQHIIPTGLTSAVGSTAPSVRAVSPEQNKTSLPQPPPRVRPVSIVGPQSPTTTFDPTNRAESSITFSTLTYERRHSLPIAEDDEKDVTPRSSVAPNAQRRSFRKESYDSLTHTESSSVDFSSDAYQSGVEGGPASSVADVQSSDAVLTALRALQDSMRSAARLRLDPTPFSQIERGQPLTGGGSARVTGSKLEGLVPTLRELQKHMAKAMALLDAVLGRAEETSEEDEGEKGDGGEPDGEDRTAEAVESLLSADSGWSSNSRSQAPSESEFESSDLDSPTANFLKIHEKSPVAVEEEGSAQSFPPSDSGVGLSDVERGSKGDERARGRSLESLESLPHRLPDIVT